MSKKKNMRTLAAEEVNDQAYTLPALAYQGGEYDTFDKTLVLHPSWQLAAHLSQLKETGDYVVHE
ncbi:MAG: hypothetical protein ACSHWU_10680, partial [Marinicella sp.]